MKPAIAWLRQDLRLSDNPALRAASEHPLICVYVLDDETPGDWKMGGASRWWLHHSLAALDRALKDHGGRLVLRRGAAEKTIPALADETGAELVTWNRCYEPFAVRRDTAIKKVLTFNGVAVESFNGSLLHEPWEIATGAGKPFRVFTPFWNALRHKGDVAKPHQAPHRMEFRGHVASDTLADWDLLPRKPDWAKGFDWTPGEKHAHDALYAFLDHLAAYRHERDRPDHDGTSRLSPHLHWGEISPRQIWHAVRARAHSDGAETFLKELGWREFCIQLLYHHPRLPTDPLDERFEAFPWRRSEKDFRAWTRGQTGIPIVDAGMRQLWQTGWMHNRVRMIAASLLIKQLGIHWHKGQEWFWDTLVDADLGNNAANWQWVAGCGADAAPFFRIFNPVLQGEKFDPRGAYVRRYVPELAEVPDRFIHRPWDAPCPPADYPAPIVDLAKGRVRALDAFQSLKRQS
ncbi:MAG: deoxyribodipyrimidine photolyase [Alphaproteobacteria bacterium 64-11]|nr:deoxyribodipyrimidine photo-lyase [Alphaproteobacteria bacterium]OJU13378.1 MAG: deoxyribodipyrimidine photolyase [Alphaproteobacteria bacterium 64-11]